MDEGDKGHHWADRSPNKYDWLQVTGRASGNVSARNDKKSILYLILVPQDIEHNVPDFFRRDL